jgi:hypothetical protein
MKRKWGQADGEDGSRHHLSSKNNRDLNDHSNREVYVKKHNLIMIRLQTTNEWTVLLRLIINTVVVTLHALIRNWATNTHTNNAHVFFQFSSVSDEGCYSIGNHCLSTPFVHLLFIAYCCVCSPLDVLIRFWWVYVDHRHIQTVSLLL